MALSTSYIVYGINLSNLATIFVLPASDAFHCVLQRPLGANCILRSWFQLPVWRRR